MDPELNRDEAQRETSASAGAEVSGRVELAHVLFMDLIAFSTAPMEEQRQGLAELQEIVRNSPQVRAAEQQGELIRLPTGDGMALVFFGDPIACIECALHISAQLQTSRLKLRMGINTGPVYRVSDINTNLNAAGGGINTAQRIMDAGDAGHILVSKTTSEILLQLKDWAGYLHDLGEHPVKHGKNLQFYNLYTAELGNAALPAKFQAELAQAAGRQKRRIAMAAALALLVAIGIASAMRMLPGGRRRSVVVIGFRNINARQDRDWVPAELAEGLRAQLISTGKVRVISGEESAEMRRDLGRSPQTSGLKRSRPETAPARQQIDSLSGPPRRFQPPPHLLVNGRFAHLSPRASGAP